MAEVIMDTKGMRCPQPVLKIAAAMPTLSEGDILKVVGDCSTFEEDIRKWCARMKKTILAVNQDGDATAISILF